MFETVYEEFLPKVTAYTRSHIKNFHDTEDIVSDVFMKVSSYIDKFDPSKASLSTWIFTITRNTICDYYRRTGSRPSRIDDINDVSIAEGKNQFVEENLESLHAALSKLSEKERDLIILRFYYGYEPAEIAEMMSLSYSNICVMQHRAIEKLKKIMPAL